MSGWAGWVAARSEHLRTVAEILSAPPSPEERRALRREEAEAEAKRASAADTADNAAAAEFMARLNGHAAAGSLAGRPLSRSGTARRPPGAGQRSTC